VQRDELAAALAANPDETTRKVFADQILSRGDPWGEILALELAGKPDDAAKLIKKHARKLMGAYPAELFKWKGGFIDDAYIDRRNLAQALVQIDEVCRLPAAMLLQSLRVPLPGCAELVERISTRTPRLRRLFLWLGAGIRDGMDAQHSALGDHWGQLSLPMLEELRLSLRRERRLHHIQSLLETRKLPSLRKLTILASESNGLEWKPDIVEAFASSPLIRQLTHLRLMSVLDEQGVARMKLAGAQLPNLSMDFSDRRD
jgi:hypothetical protein